MTKTVYLLLVDAPNETAPEKGNNKYYNMSENGDGTWTAKYGRVGGGEQSRTYSMSKWNTKYHEKLRKGYKDVTDLQAVGTSEVEIDADDPLVKVLLDDLYRASHGRAKRNYNLVSFGSVTETMLATAQAIIDEIAQQIGLTTSVSWFRHKFLELYTTIPRSMDNVEHFLPQRPDEVVVTKLVESEQDTLESLRGQVVVASKGRTSLLDAMQLTIAPIQGLPPERTFDGLRYRRGFEVVHAPSEQAFKQFESLGRKYLFHGSRKSNWLSILKTGLQVRPAANGSNFGRGIYFADDYRKSKQYTDGYMGIYDVALGRKYAVKNYNRNLSLNTIQGDSVVADKRVTGHVEYIIFRPEQCRIKWLLDVR